MCLSYCLYIDSNFEFWHNFSSISISILFLVPIDMKGSVLEVLLVGAEELKNAHILGSSRHYAIIQCGNQKFESKITAEIDNKVWWNEKFRFMLSPSECKEAPKLNVRIMEKDKFFEDCFLGETTVHLGEIVSEGCHRDSLEIKPSSYNVVLEDSSYEGELKLGLKFISSAEWEEIMYCNTRNVPQEKPKSICREILHFAKERIPWSKLFFFRNRVVYNGHENAYN